VANIDQAIDAAMDNTAAEDIDQESSDQSHDSAPDVSEDNGRGSTRSMAETNLEKVTKDSYRRIFEKGDKSDVTGAKANAREAAQVRNQQPQTSQQPPERSVDPHRMPDSWSKESRALWNQLPPAVQAAVNAREAQFRDEYAGHRNRVAFTEQLEQVVAPHAQHWQQRNIDPRTVIRDGYNAVATLHFGTNEQKVELLRQAVKAFGIVLPGQQPQRGQQQQFRDPRVDQLLHEQQQQQVRAQQQQQANERTKWASAQNEIETFAKDSRFPHFARVQKTMATLLQTGKAADLRSAYQMAVAADTGLQAAAEPTPSKHMTLASSRPAALPRVAGKDRLQRVESVALDTFRKMTNGSIRKV
jgi:hypothetical protein